MKHEQTYKGYDIYWDPTKQEYHVKDDKNKTLHTTMFLENARRWCNRKRSEHDEDDNKTGN